MRTINFNFPFSSILTTKFLAPLVDLETLNDLEERVQQFESALSRGCPERRIAAILYRLGVEDPARVGEEETCRCVAASLEPRLQAGVQQAFNACMYALLERYGIRVAPYLRVELVSRTPNVDREYGRRLMAGFLNHGSWLNEDDRFDAIYMSVQPVDEPARKRWVFERLQDQLQLEYADG